LIRAYDIIQVRRSEVPEDRELRFARYWDLAVSGREDADYIVGAKLARARDGRIYIFHIARFKGPWADARPKMIDVMVRDGIQVEQGIEVAGQQGGYYQELQRDRRLQGITVKPVSPKDMGNKEVRANVWASRIPDGLIYLIRDGGWDVDAFMAEAVAFPRGAHDDQVDGISGGVQMLGFGMGSFADVPQDDGRRNGSPWFMTDTDREPVLAREGVRWQL
jgi:predicted phage terminase large subunit-like protein